MAIWTKKKFGSLLEEKTTFPLRKGENYSFVPMENVLSAKRSPAEVAVKSFNGSGVRFKDGDTLFARITPCLQNHKIFYARGLKNGIAFGSTEFLVFRPKRGVADELYLYYLSNLPQFRKAAELSMTGASGRQRADEEVIMRYEIDVPDIETQSRIAEVLSAYDDLIENNEKRINILEETAQRLYTEWFVKFKFPGHEKVKMIDSGAEYGKIPEGWEVATIGSLLGKVKRKTKIQVGEYLDSGDFPIVDQGREFIAGYTNNKEAVYGQDLIVFGDHSRCFKYVNFPFACGADGTQLLLTNDLDRMPQILLYYIVLNSGLQDYHYARHFKFLKDLHVVKPDSLTAKKFGDVFSNIYSQIRALRDQSSILAKTRDLLIPQLVTGRREVLT